VTKGSLDKNFEDATFAMKPMMMSGIVESTFGYHLIFVEAKKPEGTQSFDEVKAEIREFLMSQHSADIMGTVKRLTNELRATSKIAFYPENVK
jgi:parvulin-like peptidyl-prolyl isomerase